MRARGGGYPRRVLMTADTIGGVWNYALELARGLGEAGVQVVLATMGAPLSPELRAEAGRVPGLEVCESQFRLEWMPEPWGDVAEAGEWLLALEARVRPDLVHLNQYAHGALPWRAPALVVGHSCVFSWHEAVRGAPAGAEWEQYREAVRRGLAAAGAVVAPSGAMLRALSCHYGGFGEGRVIYNGRADTFPSLPKEPFVLAVGRLWDEAKNLLALDWIAPELPWPVYVVGEAQHPAGGGLACAPRVQGLGRMSPRELAPWFSRASLYALPARYEPFGLSALEAALAGAALVLGDIPSLREIWGEAAQFVPPEDPPALAAVLQALIANESERAHWARLARARAQWFSRERMVTGYLELYRELLSHAGEGRAQFAATRPKAA